MPNQVFLDPNGIIHHVYNGDQNGTTIKDMITETAAVIARLQAKDTNVPLNFLVNIDGIGRQSLSARQAGARALKALPYHKIALYGGNHYLRQVTNLVILAARKQKNVKHFKIESEALAWLQR